jgi:hypothetical protein
MASSEFSKKEQPGGQNQSTDKTTGDFSRASSPADRVASLKSYHRARSLCDRCAEKWFPGHKCASTVQLHAIEEVWDLLAIPESVEDAPDQPEQIMMALSLSPAAWEGIDKGTTMRFAGRMQQHDILILVDSGSSHTFVSDRLRPQLSGVQELPRTISVQVANGQVLPCRYHLPAAEWSMSDCQFVTDMKFLPLTVFDVVLGMNWLQQYSPMKVERANKWAVIPYNGSSAYLQGVQVTLPAGAVTDLLLLSVESQATPAGQSVDPKVQSVLDQFVEVFEDPVGLPPSRTCDHTVPLVRGAHPFNIKPYRDDIGSRRSLLLEAHECAQRLSPEIVRPCHHRGLVHRRVAV